MEPIVEMDITYKLIEKFNQNKSDDNDDIGYYIINVYDVLHAPEFNHHYFVIKIQNVSLTIKSN